MLIISFMHTKYFRHISHFWPKIYIHKALQKGGVLYSLSPLVKVGPYRVHLFWPLHFKEQNGYDLTFQIKPRSNVSKNRKRMDNQSEYQKIYYQL